MLLSSKEPEERTLRPTWVFFALTLGNTRRGLEYDSSATRYRFHTLSELCLRGFRVSGLEGHGASIPSRGGIHPLKISANECQKYLDNGVNRGSKSIPAQARRASLASLLETKKARVVIITRVHPSDIGRDSNLAEIPERPAWDDELQQKAPAFHLDTDCV